MKSWTPLAKKMVTFAMWQFPHTFGNGGITRLTMDNTLVTWEKKTICSNEKVNEDEHKHREMWKKGKSIFLK
jgi:hypothetical protein